MSHMTGAITLSPCMDDDSFGKGRREHLGKVFVHIKRDEKVNCVAKGRERAKKRQNAFIPFVRVLPRTTLTNADDLTFV